MAEISTPITLLTLAVGADAFNGGIGYIPGTVKRAATPADVPARRRVRLHRDVDGMMVREAWSHAVTGEYLFSGINHRQRYTIIVYDNDGAYRAEAADNIAPEVAP